MLQTLKYIILFLLGYKVIKSLFKEERPEPRRQMPKDRVKVNPQPNPAQPANRSYQEAEFIDYEEVK